MTEEQYPARAAFRNVMAEVAGVESEHIDFPSLMHLAWTLAAWRGRGREPLQVQPIVAVMEKWLSQRVSPAAIDEETRQRIEDHLDLYLEEIERVTAKLRAEHDES